MAIQVQGNGGVVAEVEASRAVRTTLRPLDIGALGSYSLASPSGAMAAALAGASTIFSFRWGSGAALALVRRVLISMASTGTGFTAGSCLFDMVAARNFTVSDSGQTSLVPAGNAYKKRTSFATSAATDIRISNTAGITVGTRTLDATPVGMIRETISAALNTRFIQRGVLWLPDTALAPLILAQNEGFIIRATVPATGTWVFDVEVEWDEVASF